MIHLHEEFVAAAFLVFAIALAWDYLAPRLQHKKTLRNILLRVRRQEK
jgi:heme exporter protein D